MSKTNEGNRRSSIKAKILLPFLLIIVLFSGSNIYMLMVSTNYNSQYNNILNTIIAANNINDYAGSISLELRDILVGKLKAEESQYKEIQKSIIDTTI